MSAHDDGGPAFPSSNTPETGYYAEGMTLRDYFATHASEEDISDCLVDVPHADRVIDQGDGKKALRHMPPRNARQLARYIHADKMLKARQS